MTRMILSMYEIAWAMAVPGLIAFSRLREGWKERLILKEKDGFDLWIHGASVGEAHMAADIISDICTYNLKILATTNTAQGKEILRNRLKREDITIRYFPFDMPSIMAKAFLRWRPRLAVLLETELWPSFIYECNKNDIPVIIINGRLSKSSFRTYIKFKAFWKRFSPHMVYAISEEDAGRYTRLFGREKVALMNNIKFDRINTATNTTAHHLREIIPDKYPFLVLGSIRREEEQDILSTIEVLIEVLPDIVIGLFPRHIERLDWWKRGLDKKGIRWLLRSQMHTPASPKSVVLWDRFGELERAYSIGDAAFVGGSLRPCGGHNFLEPLSYGLIPCVGPFLQNFKWIDEQLFEMGLVTVVKDWKELAKKLTYQILEPSDRDKAKKRFESYIQTQKGGKKQALDIILRYLSLKPMEDKER